MQGVDVLISALTADLNSRQKDILYKRFNLDAKAKGELTLAELGKKYGITRERVRQIEATALSSVGEKIASGHGGEFFAYVKSYMDGFGNVRLESAMLADLKTEAKSDLKPLQLALLLKANDSFKYYGEDKDFYSFWYADEKSLGDARALIGKVCSYFVSKKNEVLLAAKGNSSLPPLIQGSGMGESVGVNYLTISKKFGVNQYGDFGLTEWPEICPKTIRDRAYLVLKNAEKPAHFREIATFIKERKFDSKRVYASTVHNELIKDGRFVLVGRGIYALAEQGYKPGTAREVISRILKSSGPLESGNLIKLVLKERLFKENTILLNLQNRRLFKRMSDGRYHTNEA